MSDASFLVVSQFTELTRPWVQTPNWELTGKLIDTVNEEPHKTTPALALKILDQLSDKDPKVVWLTLIIIDACMKYCPQEFVSSIASPDIMNKIYGIVKKRWKKKRKGVSTKATYSNWCGQLAATLVQDWGVAFSSNSKFNIPIFTLTYRRLIHKGIIFPTTQTVSSMPRFTGKETRGGDVLRSSVKAGTAVGVSAEVKRVVDAANEGTTLLKEIMNNIGKNEKIENNEITTQVVTSLEKNFEDISKLVPANLENEKACALLLSAHDNIEATLKKYKSIKDDVAQKQEETESTAESSEEGGDVFHIDDEKFHQDYIQTRINNYGNPFNNFLIAHSFPKEEKGIANTSTPTVSPFGTPVYPFSTTPTQSQTSNVISSPFSVSNPFLSPAPIQNPFQTGPSSLPLPSVPQPAFPNQNINQPTYQSNPFGQTQISTNVNMQPFGNLSTGNTITNPFL